MFMSKYNENQQKTVRDEISIADFLCFLRHAYKIIIIFGIVGVVLSIAYLAITPKQYEAVAQIAIAQISVANNGLNPVIINLEEPSLVIARFTHLTSFTHQVLVACKLDEVANPSDKLAKSIKIASFKGIPNLIEIRTYAASPQDAYSCAQAFFDLIKTTQAQFMAPHIESAKTKLADDEERLLKARDFLAKADKSSEAIGATYLATRDEIRFLLDEISDLNNFIASSQIRATRLISPIYAINTPITPNKRKVLTVGLLGGLLFGVLFALARKRSSNSRDGS